MNQLFRSYFNSNETVMKYYALSPFSFMYSIFDDTDIERLKILHLPILKYRRYRKDMIELFKIIKEIYDSTCVPHVDFMELSEDLIRTKGNNFKLIQHHCHYDLRKFNFTNRVILCLITWSLLILLTLLKIV